MFDAKEFIPEGRPNHWIDLETKHIMVGRSRQTIEELIADANAEVSTPEISDVERVQQRLANLEQGH